MEWPPSFYSQYFIIFNICLFSFLFNSVNVFLLFNFTIVNGGHSDYIKISRSCLRLALNPNTFSANKQNEKAKMTVMLSQIYVSICENIASAFGNTSCKWTGHAIGVCRQKVILVQHALPAIDFHCCDQIAAPWLSSHLYLILLALGVSLFVWFTTTKKQKWRGKKKKKIGHCQLSCSFFHCLLSICNFFYPPFHFLSCRLFDPL